MMHLLSFYEGFRMDGELGFSFNEVKAIYGKFTKDTDPKSPLLTLISEEIVKKEALQRKQGRKSEDYDSIQGLAGPVKTARKSLSSNASGKIPYRFSQRLNRPGNRGETTVWKEFLVGKGGETERLPFMPAPAGDVSYYKYLGI